jgi:hypothetical protein
MIPPSDHTATRLASVGMPGWLQSEQVAGLRRNRWLASSESALSLTDDLLVGRHKQGAAVGPLFYLNFERWSALVIDFGQFRHTPARAGSRSNGFRLISGHFVAFRDTSPLNVVPRAQFEPYGLHQSIGAPCKTP